MLVSWVRCHCVPARASDPDRAAWGHLEVACQTPSCRSVWYLPPHDPNTALRAGCVLWSWMVCSAGASECWND